MAHAVRMIRLTPDPSAKDSTSRPLGGPPDLIQGAAKDSTSGPADLIQGADPYEEVAARLGVGWACHRPEAVAVDGLRPGRPRVYVDGEEVAATDTLFVAAPRTLPHQSLTILLERAGFYLPVPSGLAAVVDDPMAAALHLGDGHVHPVPTVRVSTGRDLGRKHYEPALEGLTFPVTVRPTGLVPGWGLCLARDIEDLRGLLGLAEGGDATVVCQPWFGPQATIYRVYAVHGRAHSTRRCPSPGFGPDAWVPPPAELTAAVAHVATRIPTPFLAVDFVHDGERFWFAGIDLDDAEPGPERSIVEARLRAYRRGHAAWVSRPNERFGV